MATKKSTGKTSGEIQEVAEKVVTGKGKGARPNRSENMKPQVKPGDNRKFLHTSMKIWNLPKVDMSDEKAVENRIAEYFKICEEDDMKPSVAGLALALDTTRQYLYEVREGIKGKNPEVAFTIKKAMKLLDLQMTDYMQNGKINPVSGIFLMKNNFGYADKQEVVVTPNSPMGEAQNDKQLEEKYQASVIDVEAEDVD